MRKIKLLLILILLCRTAFAHNPQVSTISFIQQENKKWSVFITAPLYTCQLAINANFPKLKTDSLNVYATQNIISSLLKNNLIINGDKNIKLINTKVQVAHETTIYFDINDTVNITEVNFKAFSKLSDHFTLFKLVPLNGIETTYILNSSNDYVYQTKKEEKVAWFASLNKYLGIVSWDMGQYVLISLAVFLIIYVLFNKFNKHQRNKQADASN